MLGWLFGGADDASPRRGEDEMPSPEVKGEAAPSQKLRPNQKGLRPMSARGVASCTQGKLYRSNGSPEGTGDGRWQCFSVSNGAVYAHSSIR